MPLFTVVYNLMMGFAESMQSEHELFGATKLAEDFCIEYNYDAWLDDSEHPVWDLAVCVFDKVNGEYDSVLYRSIQKYWSIYK